MHGQSRSTWRALWCAALAAVLFASDGRPWPSAIAQTGTVHPGRAVYEARCANCHGADGRGNGPAAAWVQPRPRDLIGARYKIRSTESGSLPTDDDVRRAVVEGLHGTTMPGWQAFLNEAEIAALLDYVRTLSPRFGTEQPQPVIPGSEVPSTPESVAAGSVAYVRLQCAACHGTDGRGADAITTDLGDDAGRPLAATNLTEPWTFRGGAAAREVYMRLRTGMNGTPMPSYAAAAPDQELWDLANYVTSLRRKPVWEMTGEEVAAFYGAEAGHAARNPAARGSYLVETLGCTFCHTPVNEDGSAIEELRLAGGQRWILPPYGEYVSVNLTSHQSYGLAQATDEQIEQALTKGIRRDGSRMVPFAMPWPSYAQLDESDLDAIVAYLRTVPPVPNEIPAPRHWNFFSHVWGKFTWLILGQDPGLLLAPGNAGTLHRATAEAWPAREPTTLASVDPGASKSSRTEEVRR